MQIGKAHFTRKTKFFTVAARLSLSYPLNVVPTCVTWYPHDKCCLV